MDRQRRRVRRQVQQGHDGLPVDSERARSDLLRPARHQARSAAAGARSLPLVRQLVLTQPHADLQPPTSRTYFAARLLLFCDIIIKYMQFRTLRSVTITPFLALLAFSSSVFRWFLDNCGNGSAYILGIVCV